MDLKKMNTMGLVITENEKYVFISSKFFGPLAKIKK